MHSARRLRALRTPRAHCRHGAGRALAAAPHDHRDAHIETRVRAVGQRLHGVPAPVKDERRRVHNAGTLRGGAGDVHAFPNPVAERVVGTCVRV